METLFTSTKPGFSPVSKNKYQGFSSAYLWLLRMSLDGLPPSGSSQQRSRQQRLWVSSSSEHRMTCAYQRLQLRHSVNRIAELLSSEVYLRTFFSYGQVQGCLSGGCFGRQCSRILWISESRESHMFNKIFIGFYSYWDSAEEDMRSSHIAGNTEEDAGFNNISAPHDPVTGVLWHMNLPLTTFLEPGWWSGRALCLLDRFTIGFHWPSALCLSGSHFQLSFQSNTLGLWLHENQNCWTEMANICASCLGVHKSLEISKKVLSLS